MRAEGSIFSSAVEQFNPQYHSLQQGTKDHNYLQTQSYEKNKAYNKQFRTLPVRQKLFYVEQSRTQKNKASNRSGRPPIII